MAIHDVIRFFREVRAELSKVVWPKFDEFIGSTLIVLFLVLLFAVYLGAVDRALTWSVQYLFKTFCG